MKQPVVNDSPKKNPVLDPLHYGFNVIYVDEDDSTSTLELSKPPENFPNLTVRGLKKEKSNSFSVIDGSLDLARFTELRSLRFEHVSFLDCNNKDAKEKVGTALGSLSHLKSLTLVSTFKNSDASVDVNSSIQSFFESGLKFPNQLEEFQFHYNDVGQWNGQMWTVFGEALRSIKRFSFKSSDALTKHNFDSLCNTLKNAKTLESCEVKMPNFSKSNDFIKLLGDARLSVLEIGYFDLHDPKALDFIEKVLDACPGLETLGVSVEAWDSNISSQLFGVISEKGKKLAQLIIDSGNIKCNFDHLRSDLARTNILDIRFINSDAVSAPAACAPVDRTPVDVMKLCVEKIESICEANESNPEKIEQLISRLCLDKSSVPVLGHLINALMCIYFDLMKLDNSKQHEFNQFIAKFSDWIESGKLSYEYMARLFRGSWDPSQHDQLLTLLPAAMKHFNSAEDIQHCLGPRFMEIIVAKLRALRSKALVLVKPEVNAEPEELENLEIECCVVESLICDTKYLSLLNKVGKSGYLLSVSLFRDIISDRLGQRTQYLEDFIKLHSQAFYQTTDLGLFSQWFTCAMSTVLTVKAIDENAANKLFHVLFFEIEDPQLLYQATKVLDHLRSIIPLVSDQIFLFKLSLAILRRVIQNGYQDKQNQFQIYLKDYMKITDKTLVEAEAAIDQLKNQLFAVEVQEVKPEVVVTEKPVPKTDSKKTTLKDLLRDEKPAEVRAPLSSLLRTKKDETPKDGKPVSLKDLLNSKKESSAPLGEFYNKQSREGAEVPKESGNNNNSSN